MATTLKRPPSPPAAPETKTKNRAQIMKDYAERQRQRGHTQVKLWIPANMVEWAHRIADEARMLHDVGLKPLDRLPPTLITKVPDHD